MICLCYSRANHIIFEQVGEMASSVTYLHVKMEVDLDEIHTFAQTYLELIDKIRLHSESEKVKAIDRIKKKHSNNLGSYSYLEDEKIITTHILNIHRICDDRKMKAKTILQEVNSLRHTLPNPKVPTHIWQTQAYDKRKKRDIRDIVKNVTLQAAKTALSGVSTMVVNKAKSFIKGNSASSVAKTIVRSPRGLVALGLGALGTFMGLFNTYQIHNLEKELQQTRDAHNRLVEVVHQQLDTKINIRIELLLRLQMLLHVPTVPKDSILHLLKQELFHYSNGSR